MKKGIICNTGRHKDSILFNNIQQYFYSMYEIEPGIFMQGDTDNMLQDTFFPVDFLR